MAEYPKYRNFAAMIHRGPKRYLLYTVETYLDMVLKIGNMKIKLHKCLNQEIGAISSNKNMNRCFDLVRYIL